MSPETVSRQLSLLQRDGVIDLVNKWTLGVERLSRLLEAAGPAHENLTEHGQDLLD